MKLVNAEPAKMKAIGSKSTNAKICDILLIVLITAFPIAC